MRLEGKVIVITGASAGMGRAMAEAFVQEGAKVVAVARRQEVLEELKEETKDAPGKLDIFAGDVSKKEVCEEMIDFAVKTFGRLDVLVNNAGIMDDSAAVGNFDEVRMDKIFALNTYGVMYAMRKAVQVFLAQGREDEDMPAGAIINISSIGAQHPNAGVVYCASKAAVESMTKHTAFMYMKQGIRCNAIAPGGIITDIFFNMPARDEFAGQRLDETLMTMAPQLGEASEIANAAVYLASDESKYVNGQILSVNGGWMCC